MTIDLEYCPEKENEDQYIYRICSMKEESGMTWEQIAKIINNGLGKNYGESCYRKRYQMFQHGLHSCEDKIFTEDKYLQEIKLRTEEMYKATKQFQDQRREYKKSLADDARADHLTEEIIKCANNLNSQKILRDDLDIENTSDDEAVLFLTDWHYGMITDNIWNMYNTDICVDRVNRLLNKCKKYLINHKVNKLHIVILGDLIHGAIHNSVRVASEEDTCDQLMHVSEILAEFINSISRYVNEVFVYSTYGNHARTVQNKNDSIHSDNMEKIIPFWLKERLKLNNRITIVSDCFYEFVYLKVSDHNIVAVHGDLERFDKLGTDMHTLFNKQYGINVEYVFSGDKHHSESNESFGIDNVMVSSLCGTDEFANNKRLYSNPAQTLCIFNKEDGKVCTYNIILE